jgi:hypothetical protein
MGAVVRKDLHKLVEICNMNSGKVLSTDKIMALFGYSSKTKYFECSVSWFASPAHSHPSGLYKLGSWVLSKERIGEPQHLIGHDFSRNNPICVTYFEREKLYLYYKDEIPWWMLKEYGGSL